MCRNPQNSSDWFRALPDNWIANTPSVKMLYPQKNLSP